MKKAKFIIPLLSVFIVFVVFFSLRTSIAYLIDTDDKVNIVTVGEVELEVSEGYQQSTVAAGGTRNKAPQIKNKGTTDEYVFFRIEVPKKKVTLLYEGNGDGTKGKPTANNIVDNQIVKKEDEIFRIIANGVTGGAQKAEVSATDDPKTKPQLDFSYNKGDNTTNSEKEGWVYLKREVNQIIENVKYDVYYFGYNRCLTVSQETIPLFNQIQLKSFIDEEVLQTTTPTKTDSNVTVNVKAYGIQADSLGDGLNNLSKDAYLSQSDLNKIWGIISNKQ